MKNYYKIHKDRHTTCINCKDKRHKHYIYNGIILCGMCLHEAIELEKEKYGKR